MFMVDVILKSKDDNGRTREYFRFKGGVTLLAANQLNMNAFGYELTEEYKNNFLLALEEQS